MKRCGQVRPECEDEYPVRVIDTCRRQYLHSGKHRSRDAEWNHSDDRSLTRKQNDPEVSTRAVSHHFPAT